MHGYYLLGLTNLWVSTQVGSKPNESKAVNKEIAMMMKIVKRW